MICSDIWHKYHSWYFKIVSNFTRLTAREITYNNFKISLVVFMPNITANPAITNTYSDQSLQRSYMRTTFRSLQESWSYLHCPDIHHKWNVHIHECEDWRNTEESQPCMVLFQGADCRFPVHCQLKREMKSSPGLYWVSRPNQV